MLQTDYCISMYLLYNMHLSGFAQHSAQELKRWKNVRFDGGLAAGNLLKDVRQMLDIQGYKIHPGYLT